MNDECFDILSESGDVALKIRGRDMDELVACATVAFLALTVEQPSSVAGLTSRTLRITGEGEGAPEETVVRWLNELVYLFDAEGFLAMKSSPAGQISGTRSYRVLGEPFDPSRHKQHLMVKAATYHGLKADTAEGITEVTVLLDL